MTTIFRPYSASDSLRSDRSAGDRSRHRAKVRAAIRENIADIIAEEAIIGRSAERIVKVPIRGIKEYRFVFGSQTPQVGQATGDAMPQPGDVIRRQQQGRGEVSAGEEAGIDYYETDITLEELIDIMFEDLELPDLERRRLRAKLSAPRTRRLGYRQVGVRTHLDKRRTARQRIRRRIASGTQPDSSAAEAKGHPAEARHSDFPFHLDDMRYRRRVPRPQPESNAVVICIMDTSGSMGTTKKYLARSFFFLLHQFVQRRYQTVDLVFIAHHATAAEVSEEEFFSKGESGGTLVSSGYRKAIEIIQDRYNPAHWNVYAFHCSDGDNFPSDNEAALAALEQLCTLCNLVGYGEIDAGSANVAERKLLDHYRQLSADNFKAVSIADKSDIWPRFQDLMRRERRPAAPGSESD